MKKYIVVFDLDDTLWNLNEKACKIAGVDYNKIKNFKLHENPLLTDSEKDKLWELYQNPILWKDLEWLDGAKDIKDLESDEVEVWLVSNCLNINVEQFKRSILSKELGLPDNRIMLNVKVSVGDKKMPENTYIFVDDSPYNLNDSTAKYKIIPDRPWNRDYKNADTYRFNNLRDIIAFIKVLTKSNTKESVSG